MASDRLARNAYMREWKRKNKDSVNRTNQNWRNGNRSRARAINVVSLHRRKKANPAQFLLARTRQRCLRTGIPFNIDESDLHIPQICPVLGMRLTLPGSGKRSDASASVDRIDPKRGYVKGNVRIICWRANRLKSDASLQELQAVVSYFERATAESATLAAA